ncbi:MAG: hypothetical protein HDT26_05330 [Subdoligranulum sp.]|nr:hypothetical protein [Subdoligranulum sp.]
MKESDDVLASKEPQRSDCGVFRPTKEDFQLWAEEEERWRQEGLSEYEIFERRFSSWTAKYGENALM